VWHDFVTDEGGGILDLVTRVRGGSRVDALRFVAALAGIKLQDYVPSAADCQRWAQGQRDLERSLPNARLWWRTAIQMTEALLESLKVALFDPRLPKPGSCEVQETEEMLTALRRKDGAELVSEFRWWLENYPDMTAAMVLWARRRDREERRALDALLQARDRNILRRGRASW
jgi:hypothetical protein